MTNGDGGTIFRAQKAAKVAEAIWQETIGRKLLPETVEQLKAIDDNIRHAAKNLRSIALD